MKFFARFMLVFLMLAYLYPAKVCLAQKKKNTPTSKPDAQPVGNKADKKRDTVIILVDSRGKERIVTQPAPQRKRIDTVIILGKGKRKGEVLEDTTGSKTIIENVKAECECMVMKVNAPDTIEYENYINYVFSFKNNCKETIWINSGFFSFVIFNPNGTPVKVLRKLQYVKRYNYPQYVPLKPGTTFDFLFGDDPFFEYDLRTGWKYKFTFIYNNKGDKYHLGKTYSCTEYRDKVISIKEPVKHKETLKLRGPSGRS